MMRSLYVLLLIKVQTGGGPTGRWFMHEHWGLQDAPDFVTFSKKMLTAGYYYRKEHAITGVSPLVHYTLDRNKGRKQY